MTNVLRAEFRKLFTTQVWFWLLLGSLALNALVVIGTMAGVDSQRDYALNVSDIFGAGGTAYIFVLILGIIGITAEFRHQTITPTLLTTPSRSAVIAAKLIAYLALGFAYALIGLALSLAIALPWLSAKGIDVDFGADDVPRVMIASVLIVSLYAVFGVGFGSLITNQAAAVSLGLVITVVLQGLLTLVPGIRNVYPYTPSGATSAMIINESDRHQDHFTFLTPVQGGIVLLAWGVVLAACGAYRMTRDIS